MDQAGRAHPHQLRPGKRGFRIRYKARSTRPWLQPLAAGHGLQHQRQPGSRGPAAPGAPGQRLALAALGGERRATAVRRRLCLLRGPRLGSARRPRLVRPQPGPRAQLETPRGPRAAAGRQRPPPQHAAGRVRAAGGSGWLTKGLLRWHSDPGLAGVSLAPGLSYDESTQELVVAEAGVYYVFLHLELKPVVASAGSGSVSAALRLKPPRTGAAALAMTLDLPPPSSGARDSRAVGFRGSLLHLGAGQRLSVHLLSVHLPAAAGAPPTWQLAQGATFLGLFRVAPAGLPSPLPT
ncbi:tumor necrosis factor ligand superfamily member 9 isoform X1 [Equus quagga]|uniref:tumor necrosis factor ligand superfamily member 9 isoform X1 n=1 Tax=Equus quagga TaxID=89248 RepID=UPI001EE1960E|nr:tumor necrosis factor ligand superfamily member 9 isoform X1 [Equus quagga]